MKKPSPLKVEPKIVYLKKALFDLLDDSSPSSETTRKSPSSKERDRNKTLSKRKSISFGWRWTKEYIFDSHDYF